LLVRLDFYEILTLIILSLIYVICLVVIDVYRPNRGRILLIDINPFGQLTDSLLFDWDELNAIRDNDDLEEARIISIIVNRICI